MLWCAVASDMVTDVHMSVGHAQECSRPHKCKCVQVDLCCQLYGQEPRIIAYLYGPQERINRITNDCFDSGQKKFLVHWGDMHMYEKHIVLHEKDGYYISSKRP